MRLDTWHNLFIHSLCTFNALKRFLLAEQERNRWTYNRFQTDLNQTYKEQRSFSITFIQISNDVYPDSCNYLAASSNLKPRLISISNKQSLRAFPQRNRLVSVPLLFTEEHLEIEKYRSDQRKNCLYSRVGTIFCVQSSCQGYTLLLENRYQEIQHLPIAHLMANGLNVASAIQSLPLFANGLAVRF